MARIDDIRDKIAHNRFEFSQHAVDRTLLRRISVREIREALRSQNLITRQLGVRIYLQIGSISLDKILADGSLGMDFCTIHFIG